VSTALILPAVRAGPQPVRRGAVQRYVFGATGFWGISVGLVSATLPFRFEQLGLPVLQYGITLGAYAGGALLTEAVWGLYAFRLGRPPIIAALGLIVGFSTVLLAFARTFPILLVAEILLGAFGVYLAPVLRWVSLTYGGPGSEGSGAGRWSSVFGLGIAVGVTVGPVAFVAFGFRDVAFGSLGALAGAVILAVMLPWTHAALPSGTRGHRIAWSALATPPFLLALVLVTIAFTAMTFTTNFLQYYSTFLFGGTTSDAGYVLGAGRIVALAAAFGLGNVVDRWGTERSIPSGFALLLAGGLGTWASRSYDEMVAATLVFSAGVGWLSASLLPLAMDSMPREHQGTAIGVFGSMEDAGLLIGPLLFGTAWSYYGPTGLFPVVTALAALGVAASAAVAVSRRRALPADAALPAPPGEIR
jgi:predicted MFS family arabinose efflux permease